MVANFKRAPGVKASVVAGAGHTVSPDINVLLEGTPPQAHPVAVRGRRGTRGHCVPLSATSNIMGFACMHTANKKLFIKLYNKLTFF